MYSVVLLCLCGSTDFSPFEEELYSNAVSCNNCETQLELSSPDIHEFLIITEVAI